MRAHESAGGQCFIMTQTTSHGVRDSFSDNLADFQRARRRFAAGRRANNLRKAFGLMGTATGIEVTHGAAGWHIHSHSIIFGGPDADAEALESAMRELWAAAVWKEKARPVGAEIGLRLEKAKSNAAGTYLCKMGGWDSASEVTKSASKSARRHGRSLFELLADAGGGDARAARLFTEAVAGLHGTSSLRWSPGLKKRLLPDESELSDSEMLAVAEKPAVFLADCPPETWRVIVQHELRAALLAVADAGDADAVKAFISAIGESTLKPVISPKSVLTHRPKLDTDGLAGARLGLSPREFRAWRHGGAASLMKICRPVLR
jgi:hypothetical protein